jgi:hypothetical protein
MSTTNQLQFAIGTTDTTCLLVTANIMPSNSGVVTIDSEQIHYTVAGPNFLYGLTRGFNSTSAASHTAGTLVTLTSTDDPQGTGDLIGTAPVVVTGGSQTLAGSNATISLTSTGTGSVVRATSPTLVTPALGTPSALVLTNATGTPSAIVLTNGTGLSLTTGVTGILPQANGGTNSSGAQTTINGSAGTVVASQPIQGTSFKKVILYASGYTNNGTQNYTFPTAFTNTPVAIYTGSGLTPTISTTTVSLAGTTATGFVILSGY